MMPNAAIEVAAVLLATTLAAAAVAPWLATIFPIGSDSDASSEPGSDGSCHRLLRAIESPLLRAAGEEERSKCLHAVDIHPVGRGRRGVGECALAAGRAHAARARVHPRRVERGWRAVLRENAR